MLATVMNAVLLQGALEREGVPTRVQTAIEMRQVAEPTFAAGRCATWSGGGSSSLGRARATPSSPQTRPPRCGRRRSGRSCLKATKVDGVYDRDPASAAPGEAVLLDSRSYADVRAARLAVMDETASTLADDNGIAAVVFNMLTPGHAPGPVRGGGRGDGRPLDQRERKGEWEWKWEWRGREWWWWRRRRPGPHPGADRDRLHAAAARGA